MLLNDDLMHCTFCDNNIFTIEERYTFDHNKDNVYNAVLFKRIAKCTSCGAVYDVYSEDGIVKLKK